MRHVDDPADPQGNTVDVLLAEGVPAARRTRADRSLFASSSCGVCGKASLDRIFVRTPPLERTWDPSPEVLTALPDRLRASQAVFSETGGFHAAGLFSRSGEPELLREDVGRHNAVDKVIGARLRADRIPIDDCILLVSGRAGFEIVQKALVARIGVLAAVGAPSSLAIELARAGRQRLVGFLRGAGYNEY
jgi:FdhD protein